MKLDSGRVNALLHNVDSLVDRKTGFSYSGPAWRTATSPMDEMPTSVNWANAGLHTGVRKDLRPPSVAQSEARPQIFRSLSGEIVPVLIERLA
jgi:hypothetical protein